MKKILLTSIIVLSSAFAVNAQSVPNGNFEAPVSGGLLPGWQALSGTVQQTTTLTVNQQSYVSKSGPRFLFLQNTTTVASARTNKFALASRPKTLRFLCTYLPATPATERLGIYVLMTKKNGSAIDTIFNSLYASNAGQIYPWADFTVDLTANYKSTAIPDSALVQFITSVATPTQSSGLMIDDVTFRDWGLDITGVENQFSKNVNVFPNPAANQTSVNINFELNSTSDIKIDLYDMQGRIVKSLPKETLSYGTFNKELNMEGLTSGIYTCKVTANNQVQTTKIVVGN